VKKLLILLFAMLAFPGFALSQDEETIDHVTDDNIVVLQNGQAYETTDPTVGTWNAGDDVLILDDDKMVNKDQNEAVDVIQTSAPEDDPEE
jgi:hypothetical protein